jgi:hypothetical protein
MKKTLLAIAFAAAFNVHAADSKLVMSTGLDYSSGKYGQTEDTKITYVPFTGKYEVDRWTFKATVPYIQIEGPANVTPDSRIVVNGVRPVRSKESGLGDTVLGASYNAVANLEKQLYVDVGGKVKLPTADEAKGLGSGKTDYSLYTDVFKTQGNLTWLGTLGYKVFGDPTGVNLNNVFYGSAGLSYKLSSNDSVGFVVDLRERTTNTSTALREYSLFYSHKFDQTYKLQTYIVTGDTTSSVDLGGGAILAVTW